MSEDNETFFLPSWSKRASNQRVIEHPRFAQIRFLRVLTVLQDLHIPKMAKTGIFKIFDVHLNPLVTGHLADFFLVKTGILGMINLKIIKNPAINM